VTIVLIKRDKEKDIILHKLDNESAGDSSESVTFDVEYKKRTGNLH
jgi:hypothetical protein